MQQVEIKFIFFLKKDNSLQKWTYSGSPFLVYNTLDNEIYES